MAPFRDSQETLSSRKLASYIVTSQERAEEFIKRYMAHNGADRKKALARLKQLGVNYTRLPKD